MKSIPRNDSMPSKHFLFLLATFGVSMLVFAPLYAKLFGLIYLALALAWGPWTRLERLLYPPQASVIPAQGSLRSLATKPGRWISAHAGWIVAIMGALLIGVSFFLEQIYLFYGLAGGSLLLYGAAEQVFAERIGPARGERYWRGFALLSCLAGLGCVGFFLWLILSQGLNLPYYDEYLMALPLVTNFDFLTDELKLKTLLESHYDHRIVTTRLIILLQKYVVGAVDFHILMIIGFVALLLFTTLLYRSSGIKRDKALFFIPVIFIIFQIQYHQLIFWGSMSLVHFIAFLSVLAALACLAKGTIWAFALAIVFAVAATFSFGSGMFVFLIGLLLLMHQRQFLRASLWLVPMTFAVWRYFEGYQRYNADPYSLGPRGLTALTDFFVKFFGASWALGFFSDFDGMPPNQFRPVGSILILTTVAGAVTLLGFIYVTFKGYYRRNPALYGFLLFLMVNGALAAQGRYLWGLGAAYMSRYVITPVFLSAVLYLALAELHGVTLRRFLPAITAVALLFNIFSFYHTFPYVQKHNGDLIYATFKATTHLEQGKPFPPIYSRTFDINTLNQALITGSFVLPDRIFEKALASEKVRLNLPEPSADATGAKIIDLSENAELYEVALAVDETEAQESPTKVFVVLQSSSGTSAFRAKPLSQVGGHEKKIASHAMEGASHLAFIPKRDAPGSDYRLGIYTEHKDAGKLWFSEFHLPSVTYNPMLLSEEASPSLFHYTSRRHFSVAQNAEHFVVQHPMTGKRLQLGDAYTIQAIIRPTNEKGGNGIVLMNQALNEFNGIMLDVVGQSARFLVGDGTELTPIAKLNLTFDAWNFITFSIDGQDMFIAQRDTAHGTEAEQDYLGEDAMASPPENSDGFVHVGAHVKFVNLDFGGDIYELRIVAHATNKEDVDQTWRAIRDRLP